MTEYLIGPAGPVKTLPGLPSEGFEAPENALAGSYRAANDQDRIVAPNSAKDIGPPLPIERSGDGLRTSRDSAEHQHFADTIDPEEKLRQEGIESGSALLYAAVSNRVSGAFGGWDAGEPQFP